MTRLRATLIILLLWAGIYLPGLGSLEIKGEEGRRILPAVEMLKTGDWIVPHIGGVEYLRKPPLVNWLIAGAMKLAGSRSEWVVRLPSVLCIAMLGVVIVWVGGAWLGPDRGFVAGVIALGTIGIVEKGRLAEIEAVYVALTGVAIVWWLAVRGTGRSHWMRWLPAMVFLGLGMLAKAPVHLLFFYLVVVCVLVRERKVRELLHPAHFIGLALMIGIFAAWAVPHFRTVSAGEAAGIWGAQMAERVSGENFSLGAWLVNFPRALSNFLPWLFLMPLAWRTGIAGSLPESERPVFLGLRDATVLGFLIIMVLPGGLPRYTLPIFVPAALVLSFALGASPLPRWADIGWSLSNRILLIICGVAGAMVPFSAGWNLPNILLGALASATSVAVLRLPLQRISGRCAISGMIMVLAAILYATAVVPHLLSRSELRSAGARINAALPPDAVLRVYASGFEPMLFYVREPMQYSNDIGDIRVNGDYVLLDAASAERVLQLRPWHGGKQIAEWTDREGNRQVLLSRERPRATPSK